MEKKRLNRAQLQALVPKSGFNEMLGIRVVRSHRDGVTLECRLRKDLLNMVGTLHGGVTATMADVAAGFALFAHFGGDVPAGTVELKVNYFLPVSGDRIVARAHLIRVGKTLVVSRVDLFNEHRKLVGAALVTYMLLPAAPAPHRGSA